MSCAVENRRGDTARPIFPAGIFANNLVFSADGKYELGQDGQEHWSLYPVDGGQPVSLAKWTPGDEPLNHTTDNHSFFVRNGDIPANVYRFDFLSGARTFVRQLRPADPTGIERIGDVLITPDGKYYVYGATREINTLFVVTGLQ